MAKVIVAVRNLANAPKKKAIFGETRIGIGWNDA